MKQQNSRKNSPPKPPSEPEITPRVRENQILQGPVFKALQGLRKLLHWCLDIAFREDDSRIRMGHAANNLAIIRHFALNLIKQDKTRKIGVKGSRKRAGWDDDYMLRLLGL
jgi:hypothetical protein